MSGSIVAAMTIATVLLNEWIIWVVSVIVNMRICLILPILPNSPFVPIMMASERSFSRDELDANNSQKTAYIIECEEHLAIDGSRKASAAACPSHFERCATRIAAGPGLATPRAVLFMSRTPCTRFPGPMRREYDRSIPSPPGPFSWRLR